MIELNNKTKQDFLSREWVDKLLRAGVDMSDAKYVIGRSITYETDYVLLKETANSGFDGVLIPTYTLSEILYKLKEYPEIYEKLAVPLNFEFTKDAPFYIFYLRDNVKLGGISEYPIEAAAELLLKSMEWGIGCVKDISNKI